jgi:hypothetical protein
VNTRNLSKLATAFAAAEAKASAQGRATSPADVAIAEWARAHRTKIENALAAPERDENTLPLFGD